MIDLKPFGTTECVMCGFKDSWKENGLRYCVVPHKVSIHIAYRVTTGQLGSPQPHLHVTCQRCQYEWLTETKQRSES